MKPVRFPNGLEIEMVSEESRREAFFIYNEIFNERCYAPEEICYFDGMVIADVGANLGLFANWLETPDSALGAGLSDFRLYCIEPFPPIFETLSKNVESSSRRDQITLLNYGLGEEERNAEGVFFRNSPANSAIYQESKTGQAFEFLLDDKKHRKVIENLRELTDVKPYEVFPLYLFNKLPISKERKLRILKKFVCGRETNFKVRIRRFSDVINEKQIETIDLLKIDVEGAEFEVLKGVDEEHWNRIKQVVMEVHSDELLRDVRELLEKKGFVTKTRHREEIDVHLLSARRDSFQ